MKILKFLFIALLAVWIIHSCKTAEKPNEEDFTVTTRITRDPSFLLPSKSTATVETQINQYLYLTLANYDPHKLELIPVLLESIPDGELIDKGEFSGTIKYDCTLKKEAVWDNGQPITGFDYLFTVKLFKIDGLKMNPSIKSSFKEMIDVEVDPDNPKRFEVYVDQEFHLSKELALIAEIIPEYAYDSAHIFRKLELVKGSIINGELTDDESDSLQKTIDFINHSDCGRKLIIGSGPYKFEEWHTNQFVSITKKQNYWGSKFPENPYLSAKPERLIFAVYPDENSAITALRNGDLDVLGSVNGFDFKKMQNDELVSGRFSFFHPPQLRYYFIGMNNHSLILKDILVRKALTHLLDIDAFIQNQEGGYGERVPGPIVPSRRYFNDSLKLVEYDLEKAKTLLETAGWIDTDGNGIRDKSINGKSIDLKLSTYITGKILSKNLALILKENAAEAGIEIDIITKETRLIKQDIANRNFDLYPTGTVYGPYPEDLYQAWHSDNDFPGGSNKYGYNNAKADMIIEKIRLSKDKVEIEQLYRQIQQVIYEDQPFIFLYAPTNNIIINSKFTGNATYTKGGYLMNLFEKAN